MTPGRPAAPSLARRTSARPGLTLIEVILALAIMLLSLVAISQLVGIGSDRASEAQYQTRGTRLAQAKMAEVEAGAVPVSTGGSGSFEEDPGWSWTVETEPQGAPNLYVVTVKATRDFNGKPFEVSLTQWVFDPLASGTPAQAQKPTADDGTTTGGTTP